MANRSLFVSARGAHQPANTRNHAGGTAYALEPKHALAQYAVTGCLNHTFYADAQDQLMDVLNLAYAVEPEFVAKAALYARTRGFMKDMPAALCAWLSVANGELLERVFARVMDDGKMVRNFVQVLRSGVMGRKSLGSRPKRLVNAWLEARSDEAVFRACVGQDPSLADVVKLAHPKPSTLTRAALYRWLLGKPVATSLLPELVRAFEAYKAAPGGAVPDVPFQMLTALDLGQREWTEIARNASWQTTRMNLNTFARHGVFRDNGVTRLVARRLVDETAIARARVFPYQLLVAFLNADDAVPALVKNALQDAMELSIANVPAWNGVVHVLPDVSGSMTSPATGYRRGGTSKVRCLDVAALVAAAVLRKNPGACVWPFAEAVKPIKLNPRDSVMTNAQRLMALGGGGTNCSAPLRYLNQHSPKGDVVMYVSDNESWMDSRARSQATATLAEWDLFKRRNPDARLVCLDIQPNATTQAREREDVMNVGGFGDAVFDAVAAFTAGTDGATFVDQVEAMTL